jgi:hypothetical protein
MTGACGHQPCPYLPPGMYYQRHCNCSWQLHSSLRLESQTLQQAQEQSFISSSRDTKTPTSSQRGLWRKVLRHILCPQPSTTNLCLKQPLGIWCAPSNMVWGSYMWDGNLYHQNIIDLRQNYERYISVHLPEALSTTKLMTIFDAKPATHSAMVPRLAVHADVRGNQDTQLSSSL